MGLQLNIETGNDAMNHPNDIGEALRHVAERIEGGDTSGIIVDGNGNKVGSFSIDFESEIPDTEPDECEECGDGSEPMDYDPEDKIWRCTMCGHANMPTNF